MGIHTCVLCGRTWDHDSPSCIGPVADGYCGNSICMIVQYRIESCPIRRRQRREGPAIYTPEEIREALGEITFVQGQVLREERLAREQSP